MATETDIEIDGLLNGEDLSLLLSRAEFEEMCRDDFEKTMESVEDALDQAEMKKEDID